MLALPDEIRRWTFTFTRHFAVIHAIECDSDELVHVGSVRSAAVRALECKISDLLESQSRIWAMPVHLTGFLSESVTLLASMENKDLACGALKNA